MSPLFPLRILFALLLIFLIGDLPLSQAQSIEDLKRGVVKITAMIDKQHRIGTGFIVRIEDETAYIVTASHVVEGATLTVNFYPKPDVKYSGEVKEMDGGDPKGLAVVLVQGSLPKGVRPLPLASNVTIKGGESVTLIGFPRAIGVPWAINSGIISGQKGLDLIITGSVAQEGNSGGPILLNEKVIGVLTQIEKDFGYGVPSSITQFALKGWGVRVAQGSSQADQPYPLTNWDKMKMTVPTPQTITGKDGAPMVLVPAGEFRMGSPEGEGEADERPQHSVALDAFYIQQYEVTFAAYDKFAQATGRQLPDDEGWGRGQRPVINVSWEDAKAYAKWLSEQAGDPYRLPTEAEWEYAARSGGKNHTWAGTSVEQKLGNYAVYNKNSRDKTAEVGSKQPNALGLYDMSGNVKEQVEDCWHKNYQGAPTDGTAWVEADGGECGQRVIRGGSWDNIPGGLRSSTRYWLYPDSRFDNVGFRLAQDAP
jgi:formylglycine-generating enzyme required for sulfatase activity